ncbi:MAG TPA: alternative ribosome rescue aminoacyl-tRNA hydrolase ArfB [Solirubrobacteraceae bacterium]|jgi:ribosome-associated protein|nr:alternative ribosome rescue aminoacyl-tRNA hydrolase ArfB [Solirubrobacteraceae bacterium]
MTQPLRLSEVIEIPAAELVVRVSRSAGPGGQHANVTESRVEVSFDIAASASLPEWARERLMERLGERASAVAQEQRSQLRNREVATERLAKRLQDALARPPQRHATRPSRAARERRLQEKRRAGERKSGRRPPPTE